MASLLSWLGNVASGIERQLNPFDGGATYSNPHPQQRQPISIPNYHPNPGVVNSINQATGSNYAQGGQPAPAQGSVLRPAPRAPIVIPNYHTVQAPIQAPNVKVTALNSLINPAGAVGHWLVSPQGRQTTISLAQSLARTAPELATTIGAMKDQNITYHPNSKLEQLAFGKTPVQNIQAKVRDTQAKHGNLAAFGEGALSLAQDIPTGASAVKAVSKAGKVIHEGGQIGAIGKNIKTVEGGIKLPNAPKIPPRPNISSTKVASPAPPATIKYPVSQLKTLEAQGNAGKALAQKTIDVQTTHDMLGAASESKIPTVLKIKSPVESHNFQDVLRGIAQPINTKVAQAVKEWQAFSPSFRQTGIKAGVDIGDRGPNYFPQNFKVFEGNNYQRTVEHLIKSGQAANEGEATSLLDQMRKNPGVKKSAYFKYRSLDTGLNHDNVAAVAKDYIAKGAKTIAETTHYGKNLGKVDHLIGQIYNEGGDAQKARQIINNLVSPETSQSIGAKVLRGARSVESVAKLGTAVISHAGQPLLNDTTRVGFKPVAKAYATRFSKANRQLVQDTGVNYGLEHQRQLEQSVGSRLSKMTAPGLTSMQKFNRGVSAVAGKYKAQALVGKASQGDAKALNFLQNKLGVQGKIGKDLTPEQIVQAGRNEAVATHFSNNPAELPLFHKSELGKTVMQFRAAYGIKEGGFIVNEVLKEARKGNFAPLTRFAILAPIVGTGIYAGKAAVKNVADDIFNGGKNQSAYLPSNVFEAANKGGAFGIPGQIAEGFKYTKNTAGKLDPTKVTEAVAGAVAPLLGEGAKTVVNATKALNGAPRSLALQGLSEIPFVGGAIGNKVLPYTGGTDSGNKTLDQAITNLKTTKSQPGGKWEDYVPKEDATIAKLSAAQQQELVNQGTITQTDVTRANKLEATAKQDLGAPKKIDTAGLTGADTSFLQRYNRLSPDGKAKFNSDAGNLYQMGQIKYNQSSANGKLSRAQDINAQESLAKLKVNAMKGGDGGYLFNKDTISAYGLSKGEIADLLNAPGGQDLANKVVAYGDELVKAGAIAKNKWRDSKGRVSLSASSGSGGTGSRSTKVGKGSRGGRTGSSGTKVAKTITTGFKTAAAMKAPKAPSVKIKSPKSATFKAPSAKKLAVSKIPSSYTHKKLG